MSKVNDVARILAKGRPGDGHGTRGGASRVEDTGSLGSDSLLLARDGTASDWFWKALQTLRLKIAAIEAKFGLLPAPPPSPPLHDGQPSPWANASPAARSREPSAARPQDPSLAGPKDPALAREQDPPRVVDGFRHVTHAPAKASETAGHIGLSYARLLIANRAQVEEKAVATMTPADRAAYRTVAALVETDTEGRLALQNLVLSGRLAASPVTASGDSVLVQLAKLSTQPLGDGINRRTLVAQLLEEIDDPAKIYQGDHNTCVPAVVTIMLARRHPAEFVRLVAGLASPEGRVEMASGAMLQRAADWRAPDGGRTLDQALLQPALMAYGVKWEKLTYDNARDRLSDGGNGLSVQEANVVLQGISNRAARAVEFYSSRDGVDAAVEHIAKATAQGLPVPVGVTWTGIKGHKILVEKIADGRVYYTNPYGTQEFMTLSEFKKRLTNANLPDLD